MVFSKPSTKLYAELIKNNRATSIVMYVVEELPSIGAVSRYMEKKWSQVVKPQVFLHDEGFFVLKFAFVADRNTVLFARPHSFYGKPMIVKPWSATFSFHDEILRVVPLWI